MAAQWRARKKIMRTICPFDETVSLLQGGLQKAPKWFNSVRKYPPGVLWMTPGCVPRPHRFWDDNVRNMTLRNKERPDWVPNVHKQAENMDPLIADAFTKTYKSAEPDTQLAQCQVWFMENKGMDEDSAYRQAKYKMRNLIAQKQRVWEVYHRKRFGVLENQEMSPLELSRQWATKLEQDIVDTKAAGIPTRRKDRNGEPIRRRAGMTEQFRRKLIIQNKVLTELSSSTADEIVARAHAAADDEPAKDYFTGETVYHEGARERELYKNELEKSIRRVVWDDERQRSIEKVRLAEYSRIVQRNPQLGIGDPVALLDTLPQEARETLFSEMASRRLPEGYDPEATFAAGTVGTGIKKTRGASIDFEENQVNDWEMESGDFEEEAWTDSNMDTVSRVEYHGMAGIRKEEIWELADDEFYSLLRDPDIPEANKNMIQAWWGQRPEEYEQDSKSSDPITARSDPFQSRPYTDADDKWT